jgi:glycolate oxidase FAD binding subunit
MEHLIQQFSETIRSAAASRTALRIRGGGSKDFYGVSLRGEVLDTRAYSGIVAYEPTELIVTGRAGTLLGELEAALAEKGQMLAFEPPHFGPDSTLGGCVASGFSGPRRAYAGSARDFVLGVRMLNSEGEDLRFGGQVMKNVAGYDLSRLMTGSFGTLGLLLEISVKVLPRPELERTLCFRLSESQALESMNRWAGHPLPLSATCFVDGMLYVRLSGSAPGVEAAQLRLGGEELAAADAFWRSIRDQSHGFFNRAQPLWRFSVKSSAAGLEYGPALIEWGGALRWVSADIDADRAHETAARAGGHATLFRASDMPDGIERLSPGLLSLHKKLKHALDPNGIFGPGRLHPEF